MEPDPSFDPGRGAAPRVSVGIPVYNGDRYLARAIDSVLDQSFGDWELIVSDNASTDRTAAVAQGYAARDPRIRCIRQDCNRGVAHNWNAVARAARGEYFKWLSANDWMLPGALAGCVEVLDRQPDAVLCFGGIRLVDGEGRHRADADDDYELLDDDPIARFSAHCMPYPRWNPLNGGLIRRQALMSTGLHRNFPASDLLLIAELALRGKFRRLREVAVCERFDAATATKFRDRAQITKMFRPDARAPDRLLYTRVHFAYLTTVLRASPLGLRDRLRGAAEVLRHMRFDQARIVSELLHAAGLARN